MDRNLIMIPILALGVIHVQANWVIAKNNSFDVNTHAIDENSHRSTEVDFAIKMSDCCEDKNLTSRRGFSHCQMDCGLIVHTTGVNAHLIGQKILLVSVDFTISNNPVSLLRPPIA
jgi:hypothetical protein